MNQENTEGVGGWMLVYLVGSIPPLGVYSMGLSGWFFEYPLLLVLAIFLLLAAPLALLLVRSPKAPRWNVAMMWIAVILMTLRSISVVLFPMSGEEDPVPLRGEELVGVIQPLAVIVGFALGWAILWTTYFRRSVRVRNTFRPETAEAPGNG